MLNETQDRLYINIGCNVGDADNRSFSVNAQTDGSISDWLEALADGLRAMGFSFVDEVVVYSKDGNEYTASGNNVQLEMYV